MMGSPQLADAAARVGRHGDHGPVADADQDDSLIGVLNVRVHDLACVEQVAAVGSRKSDGLAVASDVVCGDDLAVCRVGPGLAVSLEVREQRPQRGCNDSGPLTIPDSAARIGRRVERQSDTHSALP